MESDTMKLSERLLNQTFLDPAMMASALEYWFADNGHVRSPFPEYMREALANNAAEEMLNWTLQLKEVARKELNSEMLSEKFEEMLFEEGLKLTQTDDERITIKYPFMPRLGDVLQKKDSETVVGESNIVQRKIEKRGDFVFLVVEMKDSKTGEKWMNEFELPE